MKHKMIDNRVVRDKELVGVVNPAKPNYGYVGQVSEFELHPVGMPKHYIIVMFCMGGEYWFHGYDPSDLVSIISLGVRTFKTGLENGRSHVFS